MVRTPMINRTVISESGPYSEVRPTPDYPEDLEPINQPQLTPEERQDLNEWIDSLPAPSADMFSYGSDGDRLHNYSPYHDCDWAEFEF